MSESDKEQKDFQEFIEYAKTNPNKSYRDFSYEKEEERKENTRIAEIKKYLTDHKTLLEKMKGQTIVNAEIIDEGHPYIEWEFEAPSVRITFQSGLKILVSDGLPLITEES